MAEWHASQIRAASCYPGLCRPGLLPYTQRHASRLKAGEHPRIQKLQLRRSERRHGGQAHGLRVVVRGGDDGASHHEVRHSELHGSRAGREVGVHNEGGDVGLYAW
ncbi:uncharacterized protein [Blastocystis hominis]|uniref:Uncharacterized protein n=1 Tax=Blastocystis hominis TaxID=12968 RepID=D8LZP0_BLAHO|nr:uncharacterized protein [Blastocystis hominis]CBK21279.2 unnamed protein product [Blastocystis hominis]|eukprot:XP_012895327.1 uncharacterized protein [Blastocystis hominis]